MEGVFFDDSEDSPSSQHASSINHVIGIEDGRARYMKGNKEMDLEKLRKSQVKMFDVPSDLCSVCGGKANGVHFGTTACAACSAFFRRSVVESRKYICKDNGDCDIFKRNVKGICRACRLLKCIIVGMESRAVQPHRDTIGRKLSVKSYHSSIKSSPIHKRDYSKQVTSLKSLNLKSADSSPKNQQTSPLSDSASIYECLNKPNTSCCSNNEHLSNSWTSIDDGTETEDLIEQGLQAYARLTEKRRLVYGPRSIEKLLDGSEPEYKLWRGLNHYRMNDSLAVCTANLVEFIKSFPGFCSLSIHDQMTLFRHFGVTFVIFEKYYLTYKKGGLYTKRIYRQDYTYVQLDLENDFTQLIDERNDDRKEGYFIPPGIKNSDGQLVDDQTLEKLATPYIHYALELLVKPMEDLNFTEVEFVGLVLSLLFDPNLPSLTPNGREQIKQLRDRLYSDWFNYYDESLGDNEAALKMGNSLLITPVLDDFVRHYSEFFHLLRVFGLVDYDPILNDFFMTS